MNAITTKCTSKLNGIPRIPNSTALTMEYAVAKKIELQADINCDIDKLEYLKCEIVSVTETIENPEYQILPRY